MLSHAQCLAGHVTISNDPSEAIASDGVRDAKLHQLAGTGLLNNSLEVKSAELSMVDACV